MVTYKNIYIELVKVGKRSVICLQVGRYSNNYWSRIAVAVISLCIVLDWI